MLNTDYNDIRRTRLWNVSNYQYATLTVIDSNSLVALDDYDIEISISR